MKSTTQIDVTGFTSEVLNEALEMSLEWGENWLKPIHARIQSSHPDLDDASADRLNRWCEEVKDVAFSLVEKEYPLVMQGTAGTAKERVREMHPQINDENLSRLHNQGMYYAWR